MCAGAGASCAAASQEREAVRAAEVAAEKHDAAQTKHMLRLAKTQGRLGGGAGAARGRGGRGRGAGR